MNSLYKWIVFNCVTTFVAAYLIYYHGAIEWLIRNDTTHLSFVIAGIYVLVSCMLGYSIFKGTINSKFYHWVARNLLVIGLVGTLWGMREVFQTLNFTDLKQALVQLGLGIGIAQTTTLMAISFGGLIDLQYTFVTKDFGDER